MNSASLRNMLVAVALLPFIIGPVQAESKQPRQPHIVVSGEAELEVVPDIIRLQLQVWDTAKTATDAKREVDTITARLFSSAAKHGVKNEDISAGRLNVSPEYEWRDGKRFTVGQRVQRSVDFTIRDTDSYGKLLDELVDAEVTRISSTQFDVSSEKTHQRNALSLALEDAREKAALMANALGARLGAVFQIVESGTPRTTPPVMFRAAAMDAAESAPEAPMHLGKQKIQGNVSVIFYLESD